MLRLWAIFRLHCSHCLQGRVFASLWHMNSHCPVCGVPFERETGFFLMSIYFAYAVDMLAIAPFIVWSVIHDLPIWMMLLGMAVALLLLAPFTLRFTRVLWLHLDELFDPRRS